MGTRADFYYGVGEQAEWLGSIAWDGHPDSVAASLSLDQGQSIADEADWRESVDVLLRGREDTTWPGSGWPWPWDDSRTTDYAYAWTPDSPVLVSCFGSEYVPLNRALNAPEDDEWWDNKNQVFPDMKSRKNVRWDKGSGLLYITPKAD